MFHLRAGFRTDTVSGLSPLAGLSTGMGITLWGQELSYAWLPYGDLGSTQYLSMVLRFGAHSEDGQNIIQSKNFWPHDPGSNHSSAEDFDPETRQLMQLLNEDGSGEKIALSPNSASENSR